MPSMAITWAQRLKRVFQLDLRRCECGGALKVIASIEDAATIHRILEHPDRQARAPPVSTPVSGARRTGIGTKPHLFFLSLMQA